ILRQSPKSVRGPLSHIRLQTVRNASGESASGDLRGRFRKLTGRGNAGALACGLPDVAVPGRRRNSGRGHSRRWRGGRRKFVTGLLVQTGQRAPGQLQVGTQCEGLEILLSGELDLACGGEQVAEVGVADGVAAELTEQRQGGLGTSGRGQDE